MKRADSSEDSGPRRGTLVNALRIGDERDGQIVLCYNRKDLTILCLIKILKERFLYNRFFQIRVTSKDLRAKVWKAMENMTFIGQQYQLQ